MENKVKNIIIKYNSENLNDHLDSEIKKIKEFLYDDVNALIEIIFYYDEKEQKDYKELESYKSLISYVDTLKEKIKKFKVTFEKNKNFIDSLIKEDNAENENSIVTNND